MTTFYKKVGDEYIPAYEYDEDFMSSFPKGSHLVICEPGCTSRKYNVEPNLAAIVAASKALEDKLARLIVECGRMRPSKEPITQQQRDAWDIFNKSMGDGGYYVTYPSAADIAREAVSYIADKADEIMKDKQADKLYNQLLTYCSIVASSRNND